MGSGLDGSNDTGLKFVSRPGAEPIVWDTHTEYEYYNIVNVNIIYIKARLQETEYDANNANN